MATIRCTKEEIEKWLEPLLSRLGLKEYTVNLSGTTEKGDGYLGDINFVEVSGKTAENSSKTYNFVVKCGKKSKQLRDLMPIRDAFENEILVYNSLFPAIKKFQAGKNIEEPFDNYAKCYETYVFEDMEVLVLENMNTSGYSLWNRKKPMNQEHIKEVLRNYGKLHAISFALRDQRPEEFQKLADQAIDLFSKFKKPEDDDKNGAETAFKDILKLTKDRKDSRIEEKVKELIRDREILQNLAYPLDSYAVLVHGDCWNNNFMFKYEDEERTKLSKACFLDWQLSRYVSPVFDLSYFLFTCISYDDTKYFDELNNVYYESFSDFLRKLGSDPNKLFPYEELLNQWNKYGKFGIFMMPVLIKICLSDEDEALELSDVAEAGNEISDAFDYSIKNVAEYEKRTFAVLHLAIEKGFL